MCVSRLHGGICGKNVTVHTVAGAVLLLCIPLIQIDRMYHVYVLACVGGIVFRRADLHHVCSSPYNYCFHFAPVVWLHVMDKYDLYIIVDVAVAIVTIASGRVRAVFVPEQILFCLD